MFALAYPFGWLFPVAQAVLVVALAMTASDLALLYWRKPKIFCRRELNPVFSLGDPNPISLYVENQGNLHLNLSVTDELPVQFQLRDFAMHVPLPPGEIRALEHKLTPLSRGVYQFGNVNVFATTRLGLVERRLVFPQNREVAVYPSIIQMKRFELRAMRQIAHETGIKKMRRIGHSYEFEQIKNYVAGDDYRSINWKA